MSSSLLAPVLDACRQSDCPLCCEGTFCLYCLLSREYHTLKQHASSVDTFLLYHPDDDHSINRLHRRRSSDPCDHLRCCCIAVSCDSICTLGCALLFTSVLVRGMLQDVLTTAASDVDGQPSGAGERSSWQHVSEICTGCCCAPCSACQVYQVMKARGLDPGRSCFFDGASTRGLPGRMGDEQLVRRRTLAVPNARPVVASMGGEQAAHPPPPTAYDAGTTPMTAHTLSTPNAQPPTAPHGRREGAMDLVYGVGGRPVPSLPNHYVLPPARTSSGRELTAREVISSADTQP